MSSTFRVSRFCKVPLLCMFFAFSRDAVFFLRPHCLGCVVGELHFVHDYLL
jgi:hypothetical protein